MTAVYSKPILLSSMSFIQLLFYFFITIPSAILHEYAHGAVADSLGDPTARYAGRLSLNPLVHIDLWGTILLPILLFLGTGGQFLFAYAKPVPYNPYNLKNQRFGPVAVALAGPAANFLLALGFGLVVRVISNPDLALLCSIIVYTNIALGIFNLVPIPPLDGSKLLYAILPSSSYQLRAFLDRSGFVFLLIFMFFFFGLLSPIINLLFSWFTGTNWFSL